MTISASLIASQAHRIAPKQLASDDRLDLYFVSRPILSLDGGFAFGLLPITRR